MKRRIRKKVDQYRVGTHTREHPASVFRRTVRMVQSRDFAKWPELRKAIEKRLRTEDNRLIKRWIRGTGTYLPCECQEPPKSPESLEGLWERLDYYSDRWNWGRVQAIETFYQIWVHGGEV